MASQDCNVFFAVTQRRNKKRNNVQAIKQILPKRASSDFLVEILVGGGDNTNVHAYGLVGANGLKALLLENTQNFCLCAQAHVADFV